MIVYIGVEELRDSEATMLICKVALCKNIMLAFVMLVVLKPTTELFVTLHWMSQGDPLCSFMFPPTICRVGSEGKKDGISPHPRGPPIFTSRDACLFCPQVTD
jgi:hypothetical protein